MDFSRPYCDNPSHEEGGAPLWHGTAIRHPMFPLHNFLTVQRLKYRRKNVTRFFFPNPLKGTYLINATSATIQNASIPMTPLWRDNHLIYPASHPGTCFFRMRSETQTGPLIYTVAPMRDLGVLRPCDAQILRCIRTRHWRAYLAAVTHLSTHPH